MGSQFVDYDADGKLDFFTATFDGSPHVALGVDGGFAEPVRLLDKHGKRVMLGQFWDYDDSKWKGLDAKDGHCTSAVLFDWDDDGDFDLLLGDHNHGNVFLQRNEGKAGEPSFSGQNEPVFAGGKPFAMEGGVSAPRLVDWDRDGLTDLVIGSFGETWTAAPPGGVYWYRNVGKVGAPEFAAAVTLLEPTPITAHEATHPNVGLYADPVDFDGDGKLDLLVGGYSIWQPKPPELTDEMQKRADELRDEIAKLDTSMRDFQSKVSEATAKLDDEAAKKVRSEHYASADYKRITGSRRTLQTELETLDPRKQRTAAVWVYLQR